MSAEEGFSNISCDLMLGVPEQTLTDIGGSVRHLIDLGVPHISCYSLSLEDGTLFFEKYSGKPDRLPSDEEEREMYHTVRRLLADAGYRHYEISNFALAGFESRHNTVYWDALPYYGFGCGAHSYIDGARIGNTMSLKRYIEVLTADAPDLEGIRAETERIDREAEMREVMLLGFRKLSGISTADFHKRFGIDPEQIFGHELEALLQSGRIENADGRWFLSEKGLDFGNEVFRSFVQ
jgi:oxygen-independent coproporphyrinogen-3 oxidase